MEDNVEKYKKRTTKIIKQRLQLKYTMIVLLLMILTGVIVAWGTYCLDRAIVNQLVAVNIFRSLMIAWVLLLLAVGIGLSILVSHRIAGPIYRFEKFLDLVGKGDLSQKVYLRKNDELQELSQKFNNTIHYLQQEILENKSISELVAKELGEIAEGFSKKSSLNGEDLTKTGNRLNDLSKKVKAINSHFIV